MGAKMTTKGGAKPVDAKKGKSAMNVISETGGKANGNGAKAGDMNASPSEVKTILLSQILVDLTWNARGKSAVTREKDSAEKTEGFPALVASIAEHGQAMPVDVRRNPDPKAKVPYVLVTGFRRYTAIQKIAKDLGKIAGMPTWNPLEPTIRAFVHESMGELDARRLNLQENAIRDDLSVPDLTWGVLQLIGKDEGRGGKNGRLTQEEAARHLGLTQSYVCRLAKIGREIPDALMNRWRTDRITLGVDEMTKVAAAPTAEDKEAKYEELITGKAAPRPAKDPDAWLEVAIKHAEELGKMFAKLTAYDFDLQAPDFGAFQKDILGKRVHKDATPAQIGKITKALRGSWQSTLEILNSKAAAVKGGDDIAENE